MKETFTETKEESIRENAKTGAKEVQRKMLTETLREDSPAAASASPAAAPAEVFTDPVVQALESEHKEVFSRGRSVDTRVSILISAAMVVLAAYFQIIDWGELRNCVRDPKYIFMIAVFALSLVAFVLTLICCMLTIFSKKYHGFPYQRYEGFDLNEYLEINATVNQMNTVVIKRYIEAIKFNNKTILKKVRTFRIAVITIMIFVALAMIAILLNKI